MSIKPIVSFDYLHFIHDIGKPAAFFFSQMEKLRRQVKEAAGYFWDDQNFQVTDVCGKPALTLGFYEDHVGVWNAKNGVMVGFFNDMPDIRDLVSKVSESLTQCNECGKWAPNSEITQYSFAGGVCKDCYDENRHLPPDTTGT